MATWSEFADRAPVLAQKGRQLLYRTGSGEALLATVRDDVPPSIHPIAIEQRDGGLFAFILRSKKLTDLRTDGRYALHAYPDAVVPHEFGIRGRVRDVDAARREALAGDWPFSVGDAAAFEFLVEEAILGERASRDEWPPKYTTWTERP
jgi:hypothetical protein